MTLTYRLPLEAQPRNGFKLKKFQLFCLLLLIGISQQVQAQPRSWTTVVYNGTREAWVYLPPGYNSRPSWPVVIFLHGAGERGTDPNDLLVTGLPKFLNAGNDIEAIVICPQIPATLNTWQPSSVTPARNYVISNYNEDQDKMYITGLSLGASGAELYTRTNPSHIAAEILVSGAYSNSLTAPSKDIPRYFVHGTADVTQNISNAVLLTDSLNEQIPKPVLPPLTSFHFGLTHSSAVWDGKVYNNFKPWFRWLNLHDKNVDSTALNYVDSVEVSNDWYMYWRSLRLVNSLGASAHKTNLLARLATVKNLIYGNGSRVVMDLGLPAYPSTGNVNNITDLSSTAAPTVNLITDQGVATSFGFDQISENASTEERDYGLKNSYFAGLDAANGYRDSWWIFGNGGTTRITGLDTSKKYTLRMSGASKGGGFGQEQGVKVTIAGVLKSMDNQYYNTTKYIQFTGIDPDSAGHINMLVRSYATTNQWEGYLAFIELVEEGSSVPNIPPVANAGPDNTTTLPVSSITLTGSGTDADGTISVYGWSVVSGPSGSGFTAAGSATTSVNGLTAGTYVFRLTVTDNNGDTASDDVQVLVNPAPIVNQTVNVNLYGGTNPYNNSQWNDWNVGTATVTNTTSPTLLYSDSTSSGITATLSFSQTVWDNGASYGGVMCPPQVLRYVSYSTSNRTLTLNNLDSTATYDLEFYCSRAGNNTGNKTVFIIGALRDSVFSDSNKTVTANFTSISPNAAKKIVVTMARGTGSTFQYLNGFRLVKHASAMRGTNPPFVQGVIAAEQPLMLHPNPVQGQISLNYNSPRQERLTYNIHDINGKLIQTGTINKPAGPIRQSLSVSQLIKGIYIISIQGSDGKKIVGKFLVN